MSLTKKVFKYCYWGAKRVVACAPAAAVCTIAVRECVRDISKGEAYSAACKICLWCGFPFMYVGTIGTYITPQNAKQGAKLLKLGYNFITAPYNVPAMSLDYILGEFQEYCFGHKCPVSSWSPSVDADSFSKVMAYSVLQCVDE